MKNDETAINRKIDNFMGNRNVFYGAFNLATHI